MCVCVVVVVVVVCVFVFVCVCVVCVVCVCVCVFQRIIFAMLVKSLASILTKKCPLCYHICTGIYKYILYTVKPLYQDTAKLGTPL